MPNKALAQWGHMSMVWLEPLRAHLQVVPNLPKFAILVAIIVGVPALARRVRLPELVALLFFGVALGPHGLGFYAAGSRSTSSFFSEAIIQRALTWEGGSDCRGHVSRDAIWHGHG